MSKHLFRRKPVDQSGKKENSKGKKPMPRRVKQLIHYLIYLLFFFVFDRVFYAVSENSQLARAVEEMGGFKMVVEEYGFSTVFDAFASPWTGWIKHIGWRITNMKLKEFAISFAMLTGFYLLARFLLLWFSNKFLGRCAECGKLFVMKKIDENSSQKDISYRATLYDYNSKGEVSGSHEQYIPGTRTTTCSTYKCKKCGYREKRYKSRDRGNT